ncbi:MAG: glycosyltransferase family 4 protein [Acidimicrobiia bacterium]|nr:glycosyltransferase family 4 protein [Acidimicrobiia bacterium]
MATIWFVSHYIPPLTAPGSERNRHHRFARALIERGHSVVIITSEIDRFEGRAAGFDGADFRDETAPNLTVRVLADRPYATTLQRLRGMVHFRRKALANATGLPAPDVVMGCTVHPFAANAGQVWARRHSVPFLLEMGDIWPRTLEDMGMVTRRNPAYWFFRRLEIRLYRAATRILSKLPLAKHHVDASGADPSKVLYLPNGTEIAPYLRSDYPLAPDNGDRFVVMYAGGIMPSDGLENLVDAAALVAEEHGDLPIVFQLVGGGSARPDLMARAERRRLHNVEFIDFVAPQEVPGVLGHADVLVDIALDFSVVRDFGMSHNKLFEYLGAARPIIFGVASANNPVAEAEAGISIEPENARAIADAVIALYHTPLEERLEMGRRGRTFVLNGYTIDAISSRFADIIDEVLAGLPPGSRVSADDLAP